MTSTDTITTLEGATIQHGPLNNRIYLMNLGDAEPNALIPALEALVRQAGYTKIFAKIPAQKAAPFLQAGYRKEAEVKGFFGGEEDAFFLCAYFDDARKLSPVQADIDQVIKTALGRNLPPELPNLMDLVLRRAGEDDIDEMARLYRDVFPSYPFPIHDPDYLLKTMASHVVYFAVVHDSAIVALSSAEMDTANQNVEMTDFATAKAFRGRRLATHLLLHMEKEMRQRNIKVAYTISRALSYPINFTFSGLGYDLGGLLVNNTNISGRIESMTVWHKRL